MLGFKLHDSEHDRTSRTPNCLFLNDPEGYYRGSALRLEHVVMPIIKEIRCHNCHLHVSRYHMNVTALRGRPQANIGRDMHHVLLCGDSPQIYLTMNIHILSQGNYIILDSVVARTHKKLCALGFNFLQCFSKLRALA